MKNTLTLLFAFITVALTAQVKVLPGDKTLETKWLKNEQYQMKWSVVTNDSTKHEVARINTKFVMQPKKLLVFTDVEVNNAKTTWIDSTIVNLPDFSPVHHSSDNLERAVSLKFGKTVTGKYNDKMKNKNIEINDATEGQYFDSNFYPYLIRMLPYKDGYTAEIPIYDFSPAKKGIINAIIKDVHSGTYKDAKGTAYPVWLVTSIETIKGQSAQVKYFIGKADRKVWRQEIFDGMQRTRIERSEP